MYLIIMLVNVINFVLNCGINTYIFLATLILNKIENKF